MSKLNYQQYCKGRKFVYPNSGPYYASWTESIGPSIILGVIFALIAGIWINFFPAPEGIFLTLKAIFSTVIYVLGGLIAGIVLSPLAMLLANSFIRMRYKSEQEQQTIRLASNPMVQKLLTLGLEKQICGIIITKDGIRLYNRIPDERYCHTEIDFVEVKNRVIKNTEPIEPYTKKAHWQIYDYTYCQKIDFSAEGFEEMQDDTQVLLVRYLCSELSEWGAAKHRAYTPIYERVHGKYSDTLSYNRENNQITIERTDYLKSTNQYSDLYNDYFVFDLSVAYAQYQCQINPPIKETNPKPKQW